MYTGVAEQHQIQNNKYNNSQNHIFHYPLAHNPSPLRVQLMSRWMHVCILFGGCFCFWGFFFALFLLFEIKQYQFLKFTTLPPVRGGKKALIMDDFSFEGAGWLVAGDWWPGVSAHSCASIFLHSWFDQVFHHRSSFLPSSFSFQPSWGIKRTIEVDGAA